MGTNKKQIKAYVDDNIKAKFNYIASKNKRSESNLMEILAIKCIEEYENENGKLIVTKDGTVKPSIQKVEDMGKLYNSKIG